MSASSQGGKHTWTPKKVEETKNELFRRAAQDASFRRRCLEDPAGAIAEVSGLELPAGAPRLRFVERLEERVIVLPPFRSAELADEDLEMVAGGQRQELQQELKEKQARIETLQSEMEDWFRAFSPKRRVFFDAARGFAKSIPQAEPP